MATPATKLEHPIARPVPYRASSESVAAIPKENLLAGKKLFEANIRLNMYAESLKKAEDALRGVIYSSPELRNKIDWEIYNPNSMVAQNKPSGALQQIGAKISRQIVPDKKLETANNSQSRVITRLREWKISRQRKLSRAVDKTLGAAEETGLDEYKEQLENQVRSPESAARLNLYRQKLTAEKSRLIDVLKMYADIIKQRENLESYGLNSKSNLGDDAAMESKLLTSKMHMLELRYADFQVELEKARRALPTIEQEVMDLEEALRIDNDIPGIPKDAPQDKILADLEERYRKLVNELRHRRSSEDRVYKNANETQQMIDELEKEIQSVVLARRARLEVIQNGGDAEHKANLEKARIKHTEEEKSFKDAINQKATHDLNKEKRESTIEDRNMSVAEEELRRNIRKVMGDDIKVRRIDKLPKKNK